MSETELAIVQPPLTAAELESYGVIMPLASAEHLRRVHAEKQSMYAAILDENDYIYVVAYQEGGKGKQNVYALKEHAEKAADAYKVKVMASPKKSGITKLAAALGIECRRLDSGGVPKDPGANHAWVLYEAKHAKTGRTAEGIGWCDKSEQGGKIATHAMLGTADTRGFNRAVLRLSGFGNVSAEEVLGGEETTVQFSDPIATSQQKAAALPAPSDESVIIAMRGWAEELARRPEGLQPAAQQSTRAAREMRAKAARGAHTEARVMGSMGFAWDGPAQDSPAHELFNVAPPTITVDDVTRSAKLIAATETKPAGWNLSGTSNAHEENRTEEKPITREQGAAGVPAANVPLAATHGAGSDTISQAQQKILSAALLGHLGTREACQAWLMKHANVERSAFVRQNQYDALLKLLEQEGDKKNA